MSYAGVPEAPPMAPFLKRSAAFHAVLLAAAVIVPGRSGAPPQQVYRIDFIGGSDAIMNRRAGGAPPEAAAPEPAAAKPEKQKDPDSFNLKPSFKPLPKPSFLDAARPDRAPKLPALKPTFIGPPSGAAAPAAAQGAGGSGAGIGSVSADMPDFPYPWYLTSLRQKLWDRWSGNMPAFPGEALVMFTILRDGSLVDVRVEQTSGERALDSAAVAAVRASGPLPPLPPAFREKFLTVHVQFKSN
ncbi:MAG: TonB family protein [Elusimicrobia bacterium]|nr:TonB family protein [Elusimicrobiota bacterium]